MNTCKVLDQDGKKAPACLPGTYCAGLERARHVGLTRDWLAYFRDREPHLYRSIEIEKPAYTQLSWLGEAS